MVEMNQKEMREKPEENDLSICVYENGKQKRKTLSPGIQEEEAGGSKKRFS